jgi:hypothetical protein
MAGLGLARRPCTAYFGYQTRPKYLDRLNLWLLKVAV